MSEPNTSPRISVCVLQMRRILSGHIALRWSAGVWINRFLFSLRSNNTPTEWGIFYGLLAGRETRGKIDTPLKFNAHETRIVQTLVIL